MVIDQQLALKNVLFFTFISIGMWMVPLSMPYWHVKRWYVLGGLAGKMELSLGLSGYEIDMGCDKYDSKWLKKLCGSMDHGLEGYHSFQELQDLVCNMEEQTLRILFRGCYDVQLLTWCSLGSLFMYVLCMLLLIVAGACLWLYYNGHANPVLFYWARAITAVVPFLQFTVLCIYAGLTGVTSDFFDINLLPANPFTPNSPQTITLNMSFFAAIFCMLLSCSPIAINLFALETDPYLEYLSGYGELTDEEVAMLTGQPYDPYASAMDGADPYAPKGEVYSPGAAYPSVESPYQQAYAPQSQYPGGQYPGSQYPGGQYPGSQYPGGY